MQCCSGGIKGPREMDSFRRWWPGGLRRPVATENPVVILWSLVLVETFYFRSKLDTNRMEALGEAGAG